MLADSQYAREPPLRYVKPYLVQRPIRYAYSNVRSAIRGLTRVRGPVRGVTRPQIPLNALARPKVPVHLSYVPYVPVANTAKLSLWQAIIGSWIGKLIIGLAIGAAITGIVVGTAVPLATRQVTTQTLSSQVSTTNSTPTYTIVFNASNSSIPVGSITDGTGLAFLQAQLDNITTQYSSQLSPCQLQLVSAQEASDGSIITSVTLNCGALCTGTCATQKGTTLSEIISNSSQTFVINNYPVAASNRSLRISRSVLLPEQDDKALAGAVIDGRRVAGINGLVTSVSFYADQSCLGHSIQFGAFEMNYHDGENAEFTVVAGSGRLMISKNELPPSFSNKLKLIFIPLCANSNNDDALNERHCQGVQFPMKSQEYFGSFSSNCSLGSITLERSDDAYTYVNRNHGDVFKKPILRLRYTSSGKQDVLQVPTIVAWNADNPKQRKQLQQMTMQSPPRVVFLGTYPPRGCGLATFLHDVVVNYDAQFHTNSSVIAIDEKGAPTDRVYPSRVIARLNQTERDSHLNIAKLINELDDVDVLNIQHEFGLFGGQAGEWILHLIASVRKPVLVTFHTVLQDPASIYYSITRAICSSASGIIVLSYAGREILTKVYQVDVSKIHVVPHGIPDVPFVDTLPSKRKLDLGNGITMATFGLIGRSKGLEYAIRAMKLAVAQVPNLLYIILGATHPVIMKEVGEEYRNELQSMINNLSLTNNVKLVNKYLDNHELLTYLSAVDIYLTPYPNPDQVVSGTLSIAVGCGKAVLSTPYIYARELLAHGRGSLIPFKDDVTASKTIAQLATNTDMRDAARRRAYKYGRKMIWSRVVLEFARIYENALLNM